MQVRQVWRRPGAWAGMSRRNGCVQTAFSGSRPCIRPLRLVIGRACMCERCQHSPTKAGHQASRTPFPCVILCFGHQQHMPLLCVAGSNVTTPFLTSVSPPNSPTPAFSTSAPPTLLPAAAPSPVPPIDARVVCMDVEPTAVVPLSCPQLVGCWVVRGHIY